MGAFHLDAENNSSTHSDELRVGIEKGQFGGRTNANDKGRPTLGPFSRRSSEEV
jgi:hypothetical protein